MVNIIKEFVVLKKTVKNGCNSKYKIDIGIFFRMMISYHRFLCSITIYD